jgi:hypothetical protein
MQQCDRFGSFTSDSSFVEAVQELLVSGDNTLTRRRPDDSSSPPRAFRSHLMGSIRIPEERALDAPTLVSLVQCSNALRQSPRTITRKQHVRRQRSAPSSCIDFSGGEWLDCRSCFFELGDPQSSRTRHRLRKPAVRESAEASRRLRETSCRPSLSASAGSLARPI